MIDGVCGPSADRSRCGRPDLPRCAHRPSHPVEGTCRGRSESQVFASGVVTSADVQWCKWNDVAPAFPSDCTRPDPVARNDQGRRIRGALPRLVGATAWIGHCLLGSPPDTGPLPRAVLTRAILRGSADGLRTRRSRSSCGSPACRRRGMSWRVWWKAGVPGRGWLWNSVSDTFPLRR